MSINREILRLSLPSILANITIPLVGIVDTAIAGHVSDATAIGGIAIGTMLFDLLYWNFGFLRVGTAGMTAQAYGNASNEQTDKLLFQSSMLALFGALFCLLIQYPFIEISLNLIPCSEQTAQFARKYFYIRIWAAPATLWLMSLKGWFIGMQNTVVPMVSDLTVNVVNIIFSYVLSVHTNLGIIGVAWGTLIAQYTGLVVTLTLLLGHIKISTIKFDFSGILKLIKLNGNLFMRSLFFMVIYVGYTAIASKYGDTELAVSSILMKLFMLFSYFIDGFAYAGEALTGRFIGETDFKSLKLAVKSLFVWTASIGAVVTIIYMIFDSELISLMTSSIDIQQAAKPYYVWLWLMPLVSSLAFMWDGVFVGATEGKQLAICMFLSALGFVLGYLILQKLISIQSLYVAYFIHLIVRVVYLTIIWQFVYKRISK